MTKFMINNMTDALKTDINLLTASKNKLQRGHTAEQQLIALPKNVIVNEMLCSVILETESVSSIGTKAPLTVEAEGTPFRKLDVRAKMSDPTAKSEIVPAAKRRLSRLVSSPTGPGIRARASSSPVDLLQGRDSTGSSSGDTSVVSARGQMNKESHSSGRWQQFCVRIEQTKVVHAESMKRGKLWRVSFSFLRLAKNVARDFRANPMA